MARSRPTVPYHGKYPHREHRSRKGRRPRKLLDFNSAKDRRRTLEEMRAEDLEKQVTEDQHGSEDDTGR